MKSTSETCSKCGYQFSEADYVPLTDIELAICAKENINPIGWMNLHCPRCGMDAFGEAPAGVEAIKPPGGRMARVTFDGEDYLLMSSADQLGRSVARGQAAGLITTWDKVGRQHMLVFKGVVAAGVPTEEALQKVNAADKVIVACPSCNLVAAGHTLELLVLFARPDGGGFVGSGATAGQLREMQSGRCPRCGGNRCVYLVNKSGFANATAPHPAPSSASDASPPRPAQALHGKRHFWKRRA